MSNKAWKASSYFIDGTLSARPRHVETLGSYMSDGPNGSLFISILLHNSEFRILNSEF